MNSIELQAATRTAVGNGPARALRREGRIPAILYGPSSEPRMLSVSTKDMENIIKQSNVGRSIFNMVIDGGKMKKAAMIKELQTHPVDRQIIHIDFYEVDMSRKVRVHVPVVTTGNAAGIEMGGMLQLIRRELEVLCLPNAIPQRIEIDITRLEMGQSVHVEDIQAGDNVEIPHEVNFTILTISSQKKAEEAEAEEEEAEEAAAESPAEGE